ncbi:MAG TPA: tol-pal system protein YbgF [Gammaproteobacteria bacterium]|nr:tol-pal system protein YbgF [Gammaproteobacteria bacterium]
MALVVLAAPCFVSDAQARAPAPVIEASGELPDAKVGSLEKRIQRLERLLENQTLVDLVTRVDTLQNAVSELEGQLEEQGHAMEQLKKRQRDLYLDIDRRLRALEEASRSLPVAPSGAAAGGGSVFAGASPGSMAGDGLANGTPASSTANTAPAADTQEERIAYERAFNLLKEGRYDLAVAAFKAFVQSYPRGRFTDNAQYWLGEANYVQRHFKVALHEFEKVVKDFPNSPKRADALLKMGYTYQELGDNDKARRSLNEVVMNYPNTTAARLAQKRLQELKQFP